MKIVANIELGERGRWETYMPKIPKSSKVWVGSTFYFIALFLLLGLVALAGGNALGQQQGTSPHFLHFSSNLRTNLASTTDPQSAPMTGSMLFEDAEMADTTIYVASQEELSEALKNATGGETILLAGGNYGSLKTGSYTSVPCDFAAAVTIASQDPSNPAVFSSILLRDVSNIKFQGVTVDYSYSESDLLTIPAVQVIRSTGVSFSEVIFSGDLVRSEDSAYFDLPAKKALQVSGSSNITVENCEFFDWSIAANFKDSSEINISDNTIHRIGLDGLEFAQVKDVVISGNYITNFITAEGWDSHPDFIQFWSTNTVWPSSNILITGNTLDIGDGGLTQMIFIGNELARSNPTETSLYYENIKIEQNTILGAHPHGITVESTNNLTISHNTVLSTDDPFGVPIIKVTENSTAVNIVGNATANISGWNGQMDWLIQDNAFVQNTDPNAIGFYGDVFIDSSLNTADGVKGYLVDPEGLLAILDAGSDSIHIPNPNDSFRAGFDIGTLNDGTGAILLDGSKTYISDSFGGPATLDFFWSIDDSTEVSGQQLLLSDLSAGAHEVSLRVSAQDGSSSIASATIKIAGFDLLDFDSESGSFKKYGYGFAEDITPVESHGVAYYDGSYGIRLFESGSAARIDRNAIDRLAGAEGFGISFGLKSPSSGNWGEVFRVHELLLCRVLQTGDLEFSFHTDDGSRISLTTSDVDFRELGFKQVFIELDSQLGNLSISVDGKIAASMQTFDTLSSEISSDLFFGNPWNAKNFEGSLTFFQVGVDNNDYPFSDPFDSSEFAVSVADLADLGDEFSNSSDYLFENVEAEIINSSSDRHKFSLMEDGANFRLLDDAHFQSIDLRSSVVLDGKSDAVVFAGELSLNDGFMITADFRFSPTKFDNFTLLNLSEFGSVGVNRDQIVFDFGNRKEGVLSFEIDKSLDYTQIHSLTVEHSIDSDQVFISFDDNEIFVIGVDRSAGGLGSIADSLWPESSVSFGQGDRRSHDFSGELLGFEIFTAYNNSMNASDFEL